MKAMILAAGLGTRLRPYSEHTPKPLFTIGDRPVLDITVEKLIRAGCQAMIINTHHHHRRMETHVSQMEMPVPIHTRHEPEILGTGGGIRNVADFWDREPLLVINADIVSDISLDKVYAYHRSHPHPVTMVMHHHDQFNTVAVDEEGFVTAFGQTPDKGKSRILAFTGIHVLDRQVLDFLPASGAAHIIDAYRRMIDAGLRIKAFEVQKHSWYDIGTPQSYGQAVYDHMAPVAFKTAFGRPPAGNLQKHTIAGDGSDRQWYRLTDGKRSLVMVDHGIRTGTATQEVDAYVAIGRHLAARSAAVPRLISWDRHCGLVFLQDVGDTHLQRMIMEKDAARTRSIYRRVIDQWITMATAGAKGFDTRWCHQTPCYDRGVVLENECRYFTDAFLRGYLQKKIAYSDLQTEFEALARAIMASEIRGFIHRDFQSRNIMVHRDRIYFIDFQGGRLGPVQYDLASLLIDPYTALSVDLQGALLAYAEEKWQAWAPIDPDQFRKGYCLCAVSRNLQILGAFAFLSRTKGKTQFEKYIPRATRSLVHNLSCLQGVSLPKLRRLSESIMMETNSQD
jgi:aminoglycoside/choline kinase family phosphotransferase/dTDP-glucose pyrophosphorylase